MIFRTTMATGENFPRREPCGSLIRRCVAPAVLLAILFQPFLSDAAAWSQKINVENDKELSISVSSMMEIVPSNGFFPMRIHIKNNRTSPGQWWFSFNASASYDGQSSTTCSHVFQVGANEEKTFEVMIPVCPITHSQRYAYPRISAEITGPGVNSASKVQHSSSYRSGLGALVGISQKLATRNIGELESASSTQAVALTFTRLDMNQLADDLRGFSSLDAIMMHMDDWDAMSHHHRYLLKQWVALGGSLLLAEDRAKPVKAPPVDLEKATGQWPAQGQLGWGRIIHLPLTNHAVHAEFTVKTLATLPSMFNQAAKNYESANWPLRREIPDIKQPRAMLMAIAVLMALTIGPINLFVANRRKKHIQVLWTTPAISLAASVLLAVVIILSDGFGGYGHRMLVSYLLPDEQIEVMTQEQVSRTGVLLSRDFPASPSVTLTPVEVGQNLKSSRHFRWNADGDAGGAWFTSRSIQGQILQKSQPSRARVELWKKQSDGESIMEVFSAINQTLETIYIEDHEGQYWIAENIHAGESKSLKPISEADFKSRWRSVRDMGGGRIRSHLYSVDSHRGMFFAEVKNPRRMLLESLESIHWRKERAVIMGRISEVSAK